MSGIQFITRFIAYFPDADDRGQDELARTVNLLQRSEFQLLRQKAYVLGVAAPAAAALARPADWLLDVFPGTATSSRLASARFDDAQSLEDFHRKAETSAQCYNLMQSAETHFLLESDALGLKPAYTARTPGGSILGSRIADLLRLFPALAEPVDTAALYELLGFWAPLLDRTLHRPIRRTLPGGCYRWTSAAGLSGRRGRDLRPTMVEPLWFMDQAIEAIRDTAGQSLLEKTRGASAPVLLALSGGFDSRFMAALCHDHHIPVRAMTYGRRHHGETRSARAIARVLGLELQTLPQLVDGTLRYLPQYLDATEGTADPAVAWITHLCHQGSEPGNAILHGFGGDAQAGNHLSDFSAADYATRVTVADAVQRHYYPSDRPELLGLFSPAADPDEVHQDILSGLRNDCPPYEAYQLWYLENRSRRYVATQCTLLGQHFDPVLPFYDRGLFDIWHSIPPIGLAGRAVFKRLMAHYYPALARIPHPEEAAPITPNLRWQLARFYRQLPRRVLDAAIGSERTKQTFMRLYRHDDIYRLTKLEAPQQRSYMLSQIARLRPALREGLGVELSQNHEAILAGDVQALRSMFVVARYAEGRQNTGRAAGMPHSTNTHRASADVTSA